MTCFQDIKTVEHYLSVHFMIRCKFKSYCVKFLNYWPPKLCDESLFGAALKILSCPPSALYGPELLTI